MADKPSSKALEARLLKLEEQLAEQEQAKKSLEESNIQMLDMLESISDGFFSLDENYVVTYFNGAAEELLGRKSWEILGRSLFEAFPEAEESIFQEKYTEAMEKKIPVSFETYFPVVPYENWYDVKVYPSQSGISVFFRVTTENHQVEDARKRLETKLRKAEKMRAVATLAGDVANDFNNLLSVIQSSVSLVLFDMDFADPHYATLKNIEKQARSGAKLSAQLLGYARKGRYSIDTLDLRAVMEKALGSVLRGRNDVSAYEEFPQDLNPVEGDRFQIEEVFKNILVNSLEAMPYGGTLTVSADLVTHEDMAGKPWSPISGSYVSVSITDTGIGMDKETVRQVFTPFFTLKERGEGSGLGMAAVYGIVKGHSGYIHVMSEEGWGTVVTVFLPAREKPAMAKMDTSVDLLTGSETILLVDDDDMILHIGSAILSKLGYKVIQCKGGKEAMEVLKAQGEDIALVVLDMVMPDMGGGEIFRRIREIYPDMKIILATGCSLDGQAQDILKKGCDGCIQKPFGLHEISRKVREVLDGGGVC